MNKDELGMLIHLAMSLVHFEQKTNERLDKLEQTVGVLHNNNATMTALLNDLLEQGRVENDVANRLLSVEAQLISLTHLVKSFSYLADGLKGEPHAANV